MGKKLLPHPSLQCGSISYFLTPCSTLSHLSKQNLNQRMLLFFLFYKSSHYWYKCVLLGTLLLTFSFTIPLFFLVLGVFIGCTGSVQVNEISTVEKSKWHFCSFFFFFLVNFCTVLFFFLSVLPGKTTNSCSYKGGMSSCCQVTGI